MSVDLIVGIVAAIAVITGAVVGAPRLIRDPLSQIQKQVEIYNGLPESSSAKQGILTRIEQQVSKLDTEDAARRNPSGIALGVIFLILTGASAWLVYSGGVWWWWFFEAPLFLLLLLCGIIALVQNVPSVPRAANGWTLAYQESRKAKDATKKRG